MKKTLSYAYLKIFIITLSVVCSTGVLFYNLCPSFKESGRGEPLFVVIDNGRIILKSEKLSSKIADDIKMTDFLEKELYILNDTMYTIKKSTSDSGAVVLTLIPSSDINKAITIFMWVIFGAFAISFYFATLYYKRKLIEDNIDPIYVFSDELSKIAQGELTNSVKEFGEGETAELFSNLEKLRIRLLDAIFYQKQADENRSFLVSSISHDLKTPVTAIKGYLEGIVDGVCGTDEKRKEYINKALKKTDLIAVMIDDLLYFSKLDLNQIPYNLKKINIASFLDYAVADNLALFLREGKNISLENTLKHDCFVLIDEEKFQRVTQNIIDNSLKYTNRGGKLSVILSENCASVLIEFKDDGEGIKKDELSHIFDKFYRADSARKIEGSSGLGLAIAKEITEGLGGRIWALSEEGEGTSVIISLKKM
ncbi:MAG: sensor histidine kinase [Clostridia bacterium]|nr:sensor histidine kinase [Clostridia bacterium]